MKSIKIKDLIEIMKGVNPEADFHVTVLCVPQEFEFSNTGGEGSDESNCMTWGPSVEAFEHHKLGPDDPLPGGVFTERGEREQPKEKTTFIDPIIDKNLVRVLREDLYNGSVGASLPWNFRLFDEGTECEK